MHGTIPPAVAALPDLQLFNAAKNDLTGIVPPLGSEALHTLDLQHNRLEGPIPEHLAENNPNLVKLDLSHNEFHGILPVHITSLHFLRFLDLSYNRLEGSIPVRIGDMKVLQGLFLNNNLFVGTIPLTMTRDDLQIVQLFLEHNRLSGTVPIELAR